MIAEADWDAIPTLDELAARPEGLSYWLKVYALKSMPYAEYLQTEHWQTVRERAFKIHGRRCFVCGYTFRIECHHSPDAYARIGEELPEDVRPFCHEHHQLEHEILRHVARARGGMA